MTQGRGSPNCGDFAGISLELGKVGLICSRFNPCQSLPSVVTDDSKQLKCLNVVLNNKIGPFTVWNSVDNKKGFSFVTKIANSLKKPL